jgi:hypothetical protein
MFNFPSQPQTDVAFWRLCDIQVNLALHGKNIIAAYREMSYDIMLCVSN